MRNNLVTGFVIVAALAFVFNINKKVKVETASAEIKSLKSEMSAKNLFCKDFLKEVEVSDKITFDNPDPKTGEYESLIVKCKIRVE